MQHISHGYNGVPVLGDVSVVVDPGEVACLLGPSGCGKTTLLRIAAGLEVVQAGRVVIGGRLVADGESGVHVPPEARRVGLMFQDYALFPHLSVFDNVAFGLTDRSPRSHARLREGLERVGLAAYAGSYPHVLSGGQQQRCALLRALAPEPDILLLDEPFSNLDVTRRAEVRDQTLALIRERHATTLIVTHDPHEAMAIADRMWVLDHGRVVQSGTPESIYRAPRSVFIASLFGPLNAVAGVVKAAALATPLGVFAAPGLADGTRARALIRPEAIAVAVAAPAEANGLVATVTSARLIGGVVRLSLAVGALATPIEALSPGADHPQRGAAVSLSVNPALAFVFAEEGRASGDMTNK